MPAAEARVETERPSRYLVQLCKHFSSKGRHLGRRLHGHQGGEGQALREMRAVAEQARVEWSDTEGHVALPWGEIVLRATPGVLALRVEAAAEDELSRLQDLAGGHVERFGRRDGLRVNWQPAGSPAATGEAGVSVPQEQAGGAVRRGGHLKVAGLVAVVVIVLAGLLAVVLVKVALLGGFALRRGRASKGL